jgi:hypothetical protein
LARGPHQKTRDFFEEPWGNIYDLLTCTSTIPILEQATQTCVF